QDFLVCYLRRLRWPHKNNDRTTLLDLCGLLGKPAQRRAQHFLVQFGQLTSDDGLSFGPKSLSHVGESFGHSRRCLEEDKCCRHTALLGHSGPSGRALGRRKSGEHIAVGWKP